MGNQALGKEQSIIRLVWTLTGIWAAGLFVLSCLPSETALLLQNWAVSAGVQCVTLFVGELSAALTGTMRLILCVSMMMGGYAVLSLLLWVALFKMGHKNAVIISLTGSMLFGATDELHQIFTAGRLARVSDWAWDSAGALCAMLCVLLFRWLLVKCPRAFNRETISYVIFGVLSTIVNIVAYGISFNKLGIPNLISNAIAWVAAVLFAYVVNKVFVFRSHNATVMLALREFGLFIAARLLSFGVDEFGMWLLVDLLSTNGGVSKIGMNIIVMIMNYFFSKLIIFKEPSPKKEQVDANERG